MTLDQIQERLAAAVPGSVIERVQNPSPSAQHSLRLDPLQALAAAQFLRDDPELQFDFLSNVTGVHWPAPAEKPRDTKDTEGEAVEPPPGRMEVVYHLYSMALKHGPLVIRMETTDRAGDAVVTSLTPVWRGAEFQEREVYDLYGVRFEGHPDLRRILMWDEFKDHPMRKDYIQPDDYEYEPTPHGHVLERAGRHYPKEKEYGHG
jgi:NADH-quinone oxidoreductase subunit C